MAELARHRGGGGARRLRRVPAPAPHARRPPGSGRARRRLPRDGLAEDYDLVLRLWAGGARFRNVQPVVLRWRDRAGRQSRTDPRYGEDAFVRCKVHHLRRTLLRDGRPAVVWGSGPVGKRLVRELAAAGAAVEAFVDVDPRKHGKRIYGVPVVPPAESGRFREAVALGAVAGAEGRARVRELAYVEGRRDGVDFAAVA